MLTSLVSLRSIIVEHPSMARWSPGLCHSEVNVFKINIADDFSKFPGGRHPSDGPNSGERFREKYLIPALKNNEKVEIIIDGTMGLPISFLEEAFGGLIRQGFKKSELLSKIQITTSESRLLRYVNQIKKVIETAE